MLKKIIRRLFRKEAVVTGLVFFLIFISGELTGLYFFVRSLEGILNSLSWAIFIFIATWLFASILTTQGYYLSYNRSFGFFFGVVFGIIFSYRFEIIFGAICGLVLALVFCVKDIMAVFRSFKLEE